MTTARKFGLDFVGDIPWGTHLCQFYETKHDLIDILVPYFAEGLKSNEACVWVTSEPLKEKEAAAAFEKVIPAIIQFIENGQLFILPYTEVHMKGGTFDKDRVIQWWLEKEQEALSRGFEGLRLAGNTFWIEQDLWDAFTDYEETVNDALEGHRIIAVCPYSLERCSGSDVTDVIKNHGGTIIKKGETWSVVEDVVHRKEAEAKITGLNRLYTVLSKTNEAMWRIREPKKLFEEVCRIVVEDGLFLMAWIGRAEPDTPLVKPIAHWGFEDGYLDAVTISAEDVPEGRGPTGTALREGKYNICNEIQYNHLFFLSACFFMSLLRRPTSSQLFIRNTINVPQKGSQKWA